MEDKKAEEIILLDLRPDTIMADFFVICNGTSDRQLRALTEYVRVSVKDNLSKLPFNVDGTPESGWVLMDYGDVIVHLFTADQREFYDLEGLWRENAHVLLNIQ